MQGWGESCRGGLGWVIQGQGGSFRGGVCGGSCSDGVGPAGVGWVIQGCNGSYRRRVGWVIHGLQWAVENFRNN